MKFIGPSSEYLHLEVINASTCFKLKEVIESGLTILWFESDGNELIIDGKPFVFNTNDIIFLTEFHQVEVTQINTVRLLRFNRSFYCIFDHDNEVSCKGLLFFGASRLPAIIIPENELQRFNTLWSMFMIEMDATEDNLKIEMLQMMLKRYIILCVRVFKSQNDLPKENTETDLVRSFNYLVEKHFKTKHLVADYAEMLNKSPKTISNIFAKMGVKSPLQYIQERKLLEARRLITYSKLSLKEIAFEIGYDDLQSFSRFFKNQEGISPSEFKKNGFREKMISTRE